jgi:hypothetical protein
MTAALLDDAAEPTSGPLSRPQGHARANSRARPGSGGHGPHSRPRRRSRRRPWRELSSVGQWQARAYARRPGPGRYVVAELAELVPAGYRPVLNHAEALARFSRLPGTAWLRSDSHATRWAVWQALLDFAGEDGLIVVGQHRLAERASHHRGRHVGRSTAQGHLHALVDELALGVMPGASKEALSADRDRASVYVVLAPDVDEDPVDAHDVPLTAEELAEVDRLTAALDELAAQRGGGVDELRHLPEGSAPTRTQEITQPRKDAHFPSSAVGSEGAMPATSRKSVLGSLRSELAGPARREHPERYQPRTGPEREIAVAWIAAVMGWTGKTSRFAALRIEKELHKITSPWFAAGWSPAAIVRAFRVLPDGSAWPGPLPTPDQRDSGDQPRVRNLWALLTHRLAAWRDPLGHPIDPPFPIERPPRGRPRKTPAPPSSPPPPARAAAVDAELAAFRAADNQRRARAAAEQAAREDRLRRGWAADAEFVDQADARRAGIYLRAAVERQQRDRQPGSP